MGRTVFSYSEKVQGISQKGVRAQDFPDDRPGLSKVRWKVLGDPGRVYLSQGVCRAMGVEKRGQGLRLFTFLRRLRSAVWRHDDEIHSEGCLGEADGLP